MQHLSGLPKRIGMLALCAAILAGPALAFDDPDDMPEGAGRENTFYTCIACHSLQVVTRQGMSRDMWEDTITLMIERHGMPEIDEDERESIVAYLTEHFPAVAPEGGGRRGWVNPFAP